MNYKSLLLALLVVSSVKGQSSRDTVYVSDYVKSNTYENCVEGIQQAIEACKNRGAKVLSFDRGRYDIWPEKAIRKEYFISNTSTEQECPSKIKTVGLLFDGIKGLEIDGNGALLMYHGKMIMMAFDRCNGILVHSLNTDFERPTASEIEYIKVDTDGVDVRFHRDSRYDIREGKLHLIGEGWKSNLNHCIEWDKDTHFFTYSGGWNTLSASEAQEKAPGIVHFSTPSTFQPKVGNVLTVRDVIRDQVGMFIKESENVELRDIHVAYMHGLGIVSQYATNVTMTRVNCVPNEERGRLLASSADFMHFSGCKGKITVQGCRFEGAHDDPINIHGTNLRIVSKIDDKTVKLRFMHGQSYGFTAFHKGDEVAFIKASRMLRMDNLYVVEDVKRLSEREMLVTFTQTLPRDLEIGHDCLENITYTPEVEIRDNYFTRTSTRGVLVTTPRKVVIENNVFEKTGMSAILIESDAEGWFESGSVKDVLIKNNTFIDCAYQGGPGNAIIALNPSNTLIDSNKPVHRNIRIIDNLFKTFDYPVLYAKSTQGILFQGNKIERTYTTDRLSGNENSFYFNGCKDVELKANQWTGWEKSPIIKMENMHKKSLSYDF